jgi:hypothetical protein
MSAWDSAKPESYLGADDLLELVSLREKSSSVHGVATTSSSLKQSLPISHMQPTTMQESKRPSNSENKDSHTNCLKIQAQLQQQLRACMNDLNSKENELEEICKLSDSLRLNKR